MCRIAGSVNDNSGWVFHANEFQKAGGPDANHVSIIENVSFGHCLLSIVGSQIQPVQHNRYMLTFVGELYNFKRLYPNLSSDTIAMLTHFEAHGLKAIDDFNFMGALGLYDKIEGKVHLICDRFGQKPLYYYHKGDKFYFASWPAALYDLEPSWEINKDALQSYWLLGSVMGDDSIFKGIKKLNAAEHLTYDIQTNTIKIERYWEPKFQDKTNDIEDLVLDAIRLTKVADVPVYVYLSGGIDSTLVASQHIEGLAVHLDSPERQYAERVAKDFEIDLKIVYPETIETESYLTHYAKQCGEPTMAGLIPYTVAKEVSKFAKCAISANGSDELFFGYNRTHDYIQGEQLEHIFRLSANLKWEGAEYIAQWPDGPNNIPPGRWLELMNYVQFDLNKTLDFASMCHGLEVRSPFLDHRLVEMALSIPESVHRKEGNKTILKRILRKFGFDDAFLNRQKLGFSLHRQPERLDTLIVRAWNWCAANGFLDVDKRKLTPRDKHYLEMSALGFYYWFKAWESKIK